MLNILNPTARQNHSLCLRLVTVSFVLTSGVLLFV